MAKPVLSTYRIILSYVSWWTVWIIVQTYLLTRFGIDLRTAATDAVITQVTLAVAGYALNTSMHFYNPSHRNLFYVVIWCVALAVLSVLIQQWLILRLSGDNLEYGTFLQQSRLLRGVFNWFMVTLVAVLTWFWVYVSDQFESENRKEIAEKLAREAELSNLRMQLQPHFLFNSLNSISALITTRPEQARTMIQQLSDFLRGTVKKDDRQLVNLEEELVHLQLYLDIEKVRFGHRMTTVISADENTLHLKLPSLLLQPIVENAIKFGLYDTVGEITITIGAKIEGGKLVIQIANPFDPTTAHARTGTGFGLNSVQRRLYLIYSQADLLTTRREEQIFTTIVNIPQYI